VLARLECSVRVCACVLQTCTTSFTAGAPKKFSFLPLQRLAMKPAKDSLPRAALSAKTAGLTPRRNDPVGHAASTMTALCNTPSFAGESRSGRHLFVFPKWVLLSAVVFVVLVVCLFTLDLRNIAKNFVLRQKVEYGTRKGRVPLALVNVTMDQMLQPMYESPHNVTARQIAFRDLGRTWRELETQYLRESQTPETFWTPVFFVLNKFGGLNASEKAGVSSQIQKAVINDLDENVLSGLKNASFTAGECFLMSIYTLLRAPNTTDRTLVGFEPAEELTQLWVDLLKEKLVAHVRAHENHLIEVAFNSYQCRRLNNKKDSLRVRIHDHYLPTRQSVENLLITYTGDDIWPDLNDAVTTELLLIF
jgi:hypothetical protein